MRKFNKVLSIGLATLMTCSSLPVFASATSAYKSEGEYKYQNSIGSVSSDFTDNGTSVGKDATQGKESATKHPFVDSSSTTIDETLEQTEVYATVAPAYGIKIPKTLILSASGLGLYDIGVSGDLTGTQKLTIKPVDKIENTDDVDFYMAEQGAFIGAKDDIVAKVDQTKTTWTYSEIKKGEYTWLEEAGKITADDISAGSWAGTFEFLIDMSTFKVSSSEYFTLYTPSLDSESNTGAGSDGTWIEMNSSNNSSSGINQIGEWEESYVNELSDKTNNLIDQYKDPAIAFAGENSISLYASLSLLMLGYSDVQEYVDIAKQGDEAFDQTAASALAPMGFASIDELFLAQFGISAHDLVAEIENPSGHAQFSGNGTSTAIKITLEEDTELEFFITTGSEAAYTLDFANNTDIERAREAIEFLAFAKMLKGSQEYYAPNLSVFDYYSQECDRKGYDLNTMINKPVKEFNDDDYYPTYGNFTVKDVIEYLDNGIAPDYLYSESLIYDATINGVVYEDAFDYNFDFIAAGELTHSNDLNLNYIVDPYIDAYTNKENYTYTFKKNLPAGTHTLYIDSYADPASSETFVNLFIPRDINSSQTETMFIPNDSVDTPVENDSNKVYLAIAPEYNFYTEDSFKEFLATGDESVLVENTSRKQLPKDLVLPSELYGYEITGLVPYALRGYEEIEYVYVPQTYTELDATALSNTNIKEIVIRDGGLTNINANAFNNNINLEIITLPDDIVAIPVFTGCTKLKKVLSN